MVRKLIPASNNMETPALPHELRAAPYSLSAKSIRNRPFRQKRMFSSQPFEPQTSSWAVPALERFQRKRARDENGRHYHRGNVGQAGKLFFLRGNKNVPASLLCSGLPWRLRCSSISSDFFIRKLYRRETVLTPSGG